MKNISTNITYKEAIKSNTASRNNIDNTPSKEQLEAMELVADKVFQPVREHFGVPIYISSFFRSTELNIKVGGSETSTHPKGESIDMDADVFGGVTNREIFDYIKDNLKFDQLIAEFELDGQPRWVHISYVKENNRNQILIAVKIKNKTKYKKYTKEFWREIYG